MAKPASPDGSRKSRLGDALRANLQRRKSQARERAEEPRGDAAGKNQPDHTAPDAS